MSLSFWFIPFYGSGCSNLFWLVKVFVLCTKSFGFPIQKLSDTQLCRTSTISLPPPPSQYILFVHVIGAPITRSQCLAILRNSLPFIQVSGHYRSHSFCIGMATELANRGVPDANVLEIGRLKYNAFMAYIRPQSISSHFSTCSSWHN